MGITIRSEAKTHADEIEHVAADTVSFDARIKTAKSLAAAEAKKAK